MGRFGVVVKVGGVGEYEVNLGKMWVGFQSRGHDL